MKSLVRILVISTFVTQLAQADDNVCVYDGFRDAWAINNNDETCSDGFKPWPISETTQGDCLADVGLGVRGCELRAIDICSNLNQASNTLSCRNDCTIFHIKCCCSPMYPTFAPSITADAASTGTLTVTVPPASTTTVSVTPSPTDVKTPGATSPGVGNSATTRTPTAAPTITFDPTSDTPTFYPFVIVDPPTDIPTISEFPTILPTSAPTVAPVTPPPTASPFYSCPWQEFTGYKADCVNYDLEIEGENSLCYFSSESERAWDNSGMFQGEANPFRFCTLNAASNCDAIDWWSHGSHCNSLCTNFHAICCCHPKTAPPTVAP